MRSGQKRRPDHNGAQRSLLHSQQQLVSLLCALAATANEAGTPQEAMQTSLKLICEHTGWALGRLVIFAEGIAQRRPVFSLWHGSQAGQFDEFMLASNNVRYALTGGQFLTAILRDQRPMWLEDIAKEDTFGRRAVALKSGLRSAFGFPVIVGKDAVALLEFYATEPRPVDESLVNAVTSLGAQLARLVERQKSLAANAHLAAIVEGSEDAIISRSLDGIITSWNGGAERMFGYSAAEAIGRLVTFFHTTTHLTWRNRHTENLVRGEAIPPHESQRVTKDGRVLDVLVSLSPMRNASGEIAGASVIIHDISELKKAGQAFRLVSRAHRVLSECGHALVRAKDELELVQEMCRIVVDSGGYKQGLILLKTADPARPLQVVAYAGYGEDAPRTMNLKRSQDGRYRGLAGEALACGEIRISRDILNDPKLSERRERALQLGYQSAIALPLKSADGITGVLVLHAVEAEAFDEDELALLGQLADDIAFGVAGLRIRAEHKELERRYRETFDQAAVGIAHTSTQGKYMRVNRRLCEMLGYSEQELIGTSPDDITHPDDIESSRRHRALLHEGKVAKHSSEKRYIHKDGRVLWVRRTASMAHDELGKPMYAIGMFEDITETKEAAERYRTTFDSAPVGIMHSAADSQKLLQVNPKLCEMLGYSEEELLGMSVSDIIDPEYRHGERGNYRQQMLDGRMETYSSERKLLRKDGSPLWVNRTISLVRSASGEPQYFIRMVEDISERKQALETIASERALLRAVVDAVPERIYVKDRDGRHVLQNAANVKAHGVSSHEELLGKTVFDLYPPEIAQRMQAEDRGIMASGIPVLDHERAVEDAGGHLRWIASSKVPLPDAAGNIVGVVGVNWDITERKRMEQKLTTLAHYDILTGLPNRALFNDRVTESLLHARASNWITGVMFVDLDRFKNVNDTFGHAEGDKLLKQASERLLRAVRRGDTVGRLGGDEFAVVLTDLATGEDAGIVAQKIVASFSEPFPLAGTEVYVSASIGIALHPDNAADQDTLIRNADAAMYEAKKRGRNGYQFYAPDMNARAVEQLSFESSLRRALDREEFVLHYQPKSSVSTGEITGFEALLRWAHPERGLVSPLDFIPILEETGLIVPVGEWVLGAVCAQLNAWKAGGMRAVPVSVNISARQFMSPDLGAAVKRILEQHLTDPVLIELELTESALMANTQEASHTLEELKLLGLSLSIDDFGTGYSSLAYLKRFPIDTLKIDRSFVMDITDDPDDAAIALAVISMAHSLGLKVVAEGVETAGQLRFLREHDCDQLQGYYLSKPMPAEACAAWLNARDVAKPHNAGPSDEPPLTSRAAV